MQSSQIAFESSNSAPVGRSLVHNVSFHDVSHFGEQRLTELYQVFQQHLLTFEQEWTDKSDGRTLPSFVTDELHDFLGCGILARGFAQLFCKTCHERYVVGLLQGSRFLSELWRQTHERGRFQPDGLPCVFDTSSSGPENARKPHPASVRGRAKGRTDAGWNGSQTLKNPVRNDYSPVPDSFFFLPHTRAGERPSSHASKAATKSRLGPDRGGRCRACTFGFALGSGDRTRAYHLGASFGFLCPSYRYGVAQHGRVCSELDWARPCRHLPRRPRGPVDGGSLGNRHGRADHRRARVDVRYE